MHLPASPNRGQSAQEDDFGRHREDRLGTERYETRLHSAAVRLGVGRGAPLRVHGAECPTSSCRSLGCRQRRHHRTFGGRDHLVLAPLLFGSDFTSRGGQTLAANAQSTLGLSGGVNIFPVSRLGLQVLVERASYDLSGANTPYLIALQYISRPPPSGEAQQTTLNQSNAWPDTSGSLTEWAVAFNAATRVGHPDRVGLILSAGPTFYRLSGEVQPLGFTTFRLGGHSVLFQDDYRLAASFEPSTGLGFDAGIELTAALGPHAAFVTGYRYFGGPALDARVQPTDILNTHELIQPESISSIVARLGPPAARVSMDSSRLFVGIKFRR